MIKRILLALLLVPCVTHAMEEKKEEVEKTITSECDIYKQGDITAGYHRKRKEYYAFQEAKSQSYWSYDREFFNPKQQFEHLKKLYESQESSK